MKVNKLFTLAVTLLLSTVTVVSCGNNTPTSSSPSTSASSQTAESSSSASSASSSTSSASSSAVSSSESSSAAPSSSSSAEVINYGTEDAPLTIAEAKALCDKLGENTISTAPLFVKGYVVEITFDTKYSNYEIWLSTTSTGEKEFELYACTIKDGVNTPIVGSQVIATGYYEKYVGSESTTYELTHTKIDDTRVYPTVIWSDAEAPAPTPVNYGSADSPISVADAKAIATSTESTEDCYITAFVSSVKVESDGTYTFELSDAEDGAKTFTFYKGSLEEGIDAPVIGDKIVAKGKLIYFNNYKYELTDCSVIKLTKGTKTYAVTTSIVDAEGTASTNATVTGLPTENILPGTSVTFTVTPVEGYVVDSVKYNGTDLPQNTDGTYTFSSEYSNSVSITVVEDTGELKFSLTTSTLANFPNAYPSAAAEVTYTKDGASYKFSTTMANYGKGIQSKIGLYLYNTDALPEAISSIEITANAAWTSATSALKVKFSATPFTTAPTEFDATITKDVTTVPCTVTDAKYIYFSHVVKGAIYIDEITINFATTAETTTPAE